MTYRLDCPTCGATTVSLFEIQACATCLTRSPGWLAARSLMIALRRLGKAARIRALGDRFCRECHHMRWRCTCEIPVSRIDWFGDHAA